jgi:Zn-dependent alcohol dehydrogenase
VCRRVASRVCPNGFCGVIALGESGTLDFSALVDKTRHFSEINEGFAEVREGKLTRVVLTF